LFCTVTNKCKITLQIITLLHVSTLSCHSPTACDQYLAKLHQYFNTCTVHILLFFTVTNKCTIISLIITLLHVSTLSCHPQTACDQYLAKLHQYFNTCTVHLLLFFTVTNKCTIISLIITLLHVSTLSCRPQTACNQYLAKLHQYFNTCTVHLLLLCTVTNKCTIISQIITLLHVSTVSCRPQTAYNQYLAKLHQYFNTCTVHLLLFCTVTNKCTVISQIITLLHVSTVSCRPQTACNQYLAKLHQYFKCSCR